MVDMSCSISPLAHALSIYWWADGIEIMANSVVAILGIVGLLVLGVACSSREPPPKETPEPTTSWDNPLQLRVTWVLKSLNGSPIVEETFIALTVFEDSVGGTDGCNSYGIGSDDGPPFFPIIIRPDGSYMEGKFSGREQVSTLILCAGIKGIMEQAHAYLTALAEGKTFRIQGNRLEILDGERQATLVFVRQPPLPGHQPGLARTQWRLKGNKAAVTLAFFDDEVAAGVGECVHYIGRYGASVRLLQFYSAVPLAVHRPCPEVDSIPSLWGAEQYSVIDQAGSEKLTLGNRWGETLTIEALPAVALDTEQREWSLKNIVNFSPDGPRNSDSIIGKAVPGTAVTILFQETHISGSAGCNSYQASLRITGEGIVIGPPSASGLSCGHLKDANDVMRQEMHYLSLLPQVTRIGTYDERLFMSTGTGSYLIFEEGT